MFKLVVLCAFLAAVVAEPKPGLFLGAPATWTGYAPFYGPATSLTPTSSVIHPSPIVYSAPVTYSHFIKKRSPQYLGYYGASPYLTSGHLVTPTFTSPLLSTAHVLPASPVTYSTAHLIKKRSPGFYSTPFIAPATYTATAPLLTTTYNAHSPWISSAPLLSHPISYSTHLIKKRSAQLLTPYLAPAGYSHTSRIDVSHTAPLAYSSHYLYPGLYGNRAVVIAK